MPRGVQGAAAEIPCGERQIGGCAVHKADNQARRYPDSQELTNLCDTARRHALTLLSAAQADGSLRDDFGPADLTALFLANSGIVRTPLLTDEDAWRRHIEFVFDGLRAGARTESA